MTAKGCYNIFAGYGHIDLAYAPETLGILKNHLKQYLTGAVSGAWILTRPLKSQPAQNAEKFDARKRVVVEISSSKLSVLNAAHASSENCESFEITRANAGMFAVFECQTQAIEGDRNRPRGPMSIRDIFH